MRAARSMATVGWAVLALALAAPLGLGDYYLNLGSQMLIAVVFAASLNLLVGYAGLTSLGHAAFLGLSAYLSAWLELRLGMGHAMGSLIALAGVLVAGAVFGWVALRASGLGFLMLTLALGQVVWGLGYRWVSVTDGDNGLRGLTRPSPLGIDLENPAAFYLVALLATALALALIAVFVRSPFGVALRGTRDQPRRMRALGYDVWMIRWLAFVMAAFWAGVAGQLFIAYHKYIHPSALSLQSSAEVLLAVIAGGSGTLAGPVVGAVIVVFLKNVVSAWVERWNLLLGVVFLLIVIGLPEGVVPGLARLWRRWGFGQNVGRGGVQDGSASVARSGEGRPS
jgi:branched-chain amino acid transport system permease protein